MRVRVIANPASGQDEPVLGVLNRVFHERDVEWDVEVTRGDDAASLAAKAVADEVDLVAAYGGDGTVSAVAGGLAGSAVPLAVLPGGTGNVIAQELGVPLDLAAAAELACKRAGDARPMDVMRVGGRVSLLRVGVGADARMIRNSSRERKDSLGWLAYLLTAMQELGDATPARYSIELDGRSFDTTAVTCLVANIGRIGRGGMTFSDKITPFDGRFDVMLIRSTDFGAITSVAASLMGLTEPSGIELRDDAAFVHGRGTHLRLHAEPEQPVHVDGDEIEPTPVEIELVPEHLRVVLPGD